jgi:hypothetical protein
MINKAKNHAAVAKALCIKLMDISISLFARDEGFLIDFGCSFSGYRRADSLLNKIRFKGWSPHVTAILPSNSTPIRLETSLANPVLLDPRAIKTVRMNRPIGDLPRFDD